MLNVCPDYYNDFKCIAGACRHSCCIGWEIDIDPETLAFYKTVEGDLGRRMRENIAWEGEPHFILGEKERCPFLNGENLCELILTLGEEHLCGICADHPRFRCTLLGRVETGLGLCCEEAARLILGRAEPVALVAEGEEEEKDILVELRDELTALLQQREISVWQRLEEMLRRCETSLPEKSPEEWADFFLGLERLDGEWTVRLLALKGEIDLEGFAAHMAGRETEYENLAVYLLYRHCASAADMDDFACRAAFAALGCKIIFAMGAALWTEKGEFTFEDNCGLCRLFSSEIEYSDENLDKVFDELYC